MEAIGAPTLVCHGVHDEITPFEVTDEVLVDGIENAELVRFENSTASPPTRRRTRNWPTPH